MRFKFLKRPPIRGSDLIDLPASHLAEQTYHRPPIVSAEVVRVERHHGPCEIIESDQPAHEHRYTPITEAHGNLGVLVVGFIELLGFQFVNEVFNDGFDINVVTATFERAITSFDRERHRVSPPVP